MIRMLLALVIVGLTLALVARTLKQAPVAPADAPAVELRDAVREAEQVKALVEQQQELLQRRAETHRKQ